MPVVFLLAGLAAFQYGIQAQTAPAISAPRDAPVYSSSSIVNAADNLVETLAPNTIATLYGKNLAYATASLTSSEVNGGTLPTVLPGTGVHVVVGGLLANLYYVSPTQINFLVPLNLLPGTINVQVVIDGLAGPSIPLQLGPAAPALFQLDSQHAVATRPDGSVITSVAPAKPGDIVILYATGLGQTNPPLAYDELPMSAAPLADAASFRLTLDGVAVDSHAILYAGIAPGFAGLYQINVTLPASTGANPEIRIGTGAALSMPGLQLAVQPQ